MPFTSESLILTRISSDQLDAMKGPGSTKLAAAIAETDALLTASTGLAPAAAAADNHQVLTSIASRIVIWTLSGNVQGLEEVESSRRRKDYEDALADLKRIRSGELKISSEAASSAGTVSCQPQRVTEW